MVAASRSVNRMRPLRRPPPRRPEQNCQGAGRLQEPNMRERSRTNTLRNRRPSGRHIGGSAPGREGPALLYGWHTVSAALQNPARRIRRLWATENAARRLAEANISASVAPELVRPDAIAARLPPDAVHQGLLAEADPLPAGAVEDLDDGIVLVLDQSTDPHNL